MQNRIRVTGIEHVIFVDDTIYPESVSEFTHELKQQELVFFFSGESTVQFGNKVLYDRTNHVRYLPKGHPSVYRVERHSKHTCIDIFFDTDVPLSEEAFTCPAPQVSLLFRKLFSVWCAKDEGYYYECMALLYRILAQLQKTNHISGRQYQLIQPALAYIEEHLLDGKISAQQLAECCGISYSYLRQLFFRKYGKHPTRYILERKLAYACDLIQSHRYSIVQTAEICGYSDVSFFSRQFKEYFGVSPSAYQKKNHAASSGVKPLKHNRMEGTGRERVGILPDGDLLVEGEGIEHHDGR